MSAGVYTPAVSAALSRFDRAWRVGPLSLVNDAYMQFSRQMGDVIRSTHSAIQDVYAHSWALTTNSALPSPPSFEAGLTSAKATLASMNEQYEAGLVALAIAFENAATRKASSADPECTAALGTASGYLGQVQTMSADVRTTLARATKTAVLELIDSKIAALNRSAAQMSALVARVRAHIAAGTWSAVAARVNGIPTVDAMEKQIAEAVPQAMAFRIEAAAWVHTPQVSVVRSCPFLSGHAVWAITAGDIAGLESALVRADALVEAKAAAAPVSNPAAPAAAGGAGASPCIGPFVPEEAEDATPYIGPCVPEDADDERLAAPAAVPSSDKEEIAQLKRQVALLTEAVLKLLPLAAAKELAAVSHLHGMTQSLSAGTAAEHYAAPEYLGAGATDGKIFKTAEELTPVRDAQQVVLNRTHVLLAALSCP